MDDPLLLLLALFFSTLLASETSVHAQTSSNFLNIDCGKPEGYTYTDTAKDLGLTYTSDYAYIDTGEIGKVSPEYLSLGYRRNLDDLRSFPNGTRNCYTLKPVKLGAKYFIRALFLYGNYDRENLLPQFDIYLGVNFWDSISFDKASDYIKSEILAVAASDLLSLCLANTGQGTPFISAIEVRPLSDDFYPSLLSSSRAFRYFYMGNFGGDFYRYPNDIYDREWENLTLSGWTSINTTSNVAATVTAFQPPSVVMRTASTPTSDSFLEFVWKSTVDTRFPENLFFIAMHFAELKPLNTSQSRNFDIYINDKIWHSNVEPVYLKTTTVYSSSPENYKKIDVNITQTGGSNLPPIINAIEVYRVMDFSRLETDGGDVAAITEIKNLYKLRRNWMGDPCAPEEFIWVGLNCSYNNSSSPRIISLNLSSSGLSGEIPISLSNLTQLRYLDLSENELTGAIPNFLANLPNLKFLDLRGNNLTGPIPQELQNNVASGTLTLWIGNPETKVGNKKKNSKSIIAAVVGSICAVLFVAVVVALILCYTRKKKRNRDSVQGKQKKEYEQQKQTSPGGVFHSENRRFTYDDIVKITRKFSKVIGEGGFGFVYLGVLENGTQVAVKVLSKTSTQGHKQFQNEAVLLSKIHHRNLVALFGYCSDPDHLALVYEYMEEGSLDDHLSGKTGNEKLSGWKKRLEIAVGAAQGLEYLHEGCKLSIVHRDVKTKNILLDRNMETKIADFGLSKIFQNDMQTYVSTVVMGTPGYLDPEYSSTNMLKEKSDVYSFGIVLLQLATGLPAIIRGKENTHIVNWVIQWYEKGAIEEIVDKRLDGKYDIGSVWKMLEVALTCASPVSSERPTMAEVLVQLKDCLVMESGRDRFQGDMSTVEDETLLDLQAR